MLYILFSQIYYNRILEYKRQKIEVLTNNNRAYETEINGQIMQKGIFLMNIAEISKSRDSITKLLNQTRQELQIKDRELNRASYFRTVVKDTVWSTIEYRDTVLLINPSICDFNKIIEYNHLTSVELSVINGNIQSVLNFEDSFQIFDLSRQY